jgi:cytochrome oxidase Cu insertion factor (SCO1/SenC/PrrC family)
VLALTALAFILSVTAVWWAVALWPVSPAAPAWLQAARAVCFGAHDDGLPSAGGWILLVGEPIGMMAALLVVWREPLLAGLSRLRAWPLGRSVIAFSGLAIVAGIGAAGWRVATATAPLDPVDSSPDVPALWSLTGPAPPIGLVDQHGEVLALERFRGRPVLVTFAFAHCETICPLLVQDAQRARRRLDPVPALVVITLDPWRDVPSRLPSMAAAWGMGGDAFVVSGDIDAVVRVLREWNAEGARDPRTGEVVHAPVTYVLDEEAQLAFATTGGTEALVQAVHRLK